MVDKIELVTLAEKQITNRGLAEQMDVADILSWQNSTARM